MNGNVRPDLLRNSPMGQTAPMLGMSNPTAFMQNPAQMTQQQMSMQANMNPNQPMNMLNSASVPLPSNQQNQRMMMQPHSVPQLPGGQQQGRPGMPMRTGQAPQVMMGPANAQGGPRIPAMGMQGPHAFGAGMPQQPNLNQNSGLRRAPSQSQMGMNAGGPVPGGMGLPGHPANPVAAQQAAIQQQQQLHQLQLQQARQLQIGQRQGPNAVMQSPMGAMAPSQSNVMSSLQQPSSIASQPHPLGIGHGQLPNHTFPNGVGAPNPQQQPPQQQQQHRLTSSSPRPMAPNGMGPSQAPMNRASMTPDNNNAMFMNSYPGGQFSPTSQRMPSAAGGQFPFNPTSTPPISDMQDQGRGPFPTPAQQLLMNNVNGGGMPNPPDPFFNPPSIPRPASQNPMTPLPGHSSQLPQRQTPQPNAQQQGTPQPGPPTAHHPSPMQSASSELSMHPSRPQSRPQSQPQIPNNQPTGPHGQTPRNTQIPLPPGSGMMPPGRIAQQPTPAPTIPPPPSSQPSHMLQPQHTGGAPQAPGANQLQQQSHMNMGRYDHTTMAPGMVPPPTAGPSTIPPRSHPQSAVGTGQALVRLLQFSGVLAGESKQKLQLLWWNELVKEYFTPKAVMKFTLWKDNQQQEAKPFEIGIPILPRFFLVTTQSGVKSMTLTLDGARERVFTPGHAVVECVSAVWTYKYTNGYTVTLRGPLTAHVIVVATQPPNAQQGPGWTLKIEEFEFGATHHDKYISSEAIMGERSFETPMVRPVNLMAAPSPPSKSLELQRIIDDEHQRYEEPRMIIERAIIPGEPVNAFGIPQATMRCLELAESVGAMAELISYADETKLGPLDALSTFADKLRKSGMTLNSPTPAPVQVHPIQQPIQQPPPNAMPGQGPMSGIIPPPPNSQAAVSQQQHQHQQYQQQHIPPPQPHLTLYQSAPASVINSHLPNNSHPIIPPPPTATIVGSPQNTTSSASNSPQKQHRSIPQNAASSSTASGSSQTATSPAMSGGTGTTNNTPALSNASLKRKGGPNDAASPTMAPGDSNAKRTTRKRNRTGTTG